MLDWPRAMQSSRVKRIGFACRGVGGILHFGFWLFSLGTRRKKSISRPSVRVRPSFRPRENVRRALSVTNHLFKARVICVFSGKQTRKAKEEEEERKRETEVSRFETRDAVETSLSRRD